MSLGLRVDENVESRPDQGATRLSRAELEARRNLVLVRGRWAKADLWTAILDDGSEVVIKDFHSKAMIGRLWGRIQVSREAQVLALLSGLEVVPRFFGKLGRDAIVLEYIKGKELHRCRGRSPVRRCLEQLRRAIEQVHERGVIHNDLRGRENVLVREGDGNVVIIDWAAAVRLRPGGLLHRAFFRGLRLIDMGALLKWKHILDPHGMTAAESRFLVRFEFLRAFWPFNRKHHSKEARRDR